MNEELKRHLQSEREGLVKYLRMKTDSSDWHGVADAAMDLREIEVQLLLLTVLEEKTKTVL